jgi:hypothetical protein
MRFLVRLVPGDADRQAFLAAVRSIAANLGANAVNPKWTSYGALEMDIFAPTPQDFQLVLAALEPLGETEFAKDLQEPQRLMTKEKALEEAVALFNGERFWEAHEVLETLWRAAEGNEKKLLQGLILVCAAFVHHQKDEERVALGVARRAIPLPVWGGSSYGSIDVIAVIDRLNRLEAEGKLSIFEL